MPGEEFMRAFHILDLELRLSCPTLAECSENTEIVHLGARVRGSTGALSPLVELARWVTASKGEGHWLSSAVHGLGVLNEHWGNDVHFELWSDGPIDFLVDLRLLLNTRRFGSVHATSDQVARDYVQVTNGGLLGPNYNTHDPENGQIRRVEIDFAEILERDEGEAGKFFRTENVFFNAIISQHGRGMDDLDCGEFCASFVCLYFRRSSFRNLDSVPRLYVQY
eukprot:GABV01001861.1.p1 GENE.GABV01001861.1~~GABV01001861.1.p1  ORF type:complete len:223 (+),score=52.83 GABV01001861.1:114-782(+)